MGVVIAAMHEQLHQRVAIKLLLPELLSNPEAVARFAREARSAVRIQSEHVARVLDVGSLESGAPYMVMEYLEGRDLAAILGDQGRLPVDEAADFVLQACEALSEAHVVGIIHRDLKPANLFVIRRADGSPCIKLLDFGISKASAGADADASLTKTTAFMGSPLYVSPEQLVSTRTADARSDIWALGVILYESLSGELPFTGESVMEIASRVLQGEPTSLRMRRPDLPRELCDVVMRCLEKDLERRYANVGQLARALAPFAPRSAMSVERISRVVGAETITATGEPLSAGPRSVVTPRPAGAQGTPEGPTLGAWDRAEGADRNRSKRLWLPLALGAGPVALLGAMLAIAAGVGRPTVVATAPVTVPETSTAGASDASAIEGAATLRSAMPTDLPAPRAATPEQGAAPQFVVGSRPAPAVAPAPKGAAPFVPAAHPAHPENRGPAFAKPDAVPSATEAVVAATASASSPAPTARRNPLAVDLK
jgi:serine/threonine-protein kinase